MKIAVIGWGSLIWQPGVLDVEPEWRTDGPVLPIEFARVSGRDRLTLVIGGGFSQQTTLWAFSQKSSLFEAADNLRMREGTKEKMIGMWSIDEQEPKPEDIVSFSIDSWARRQNLDAVVWTALGPKRPDGQDGLASDEELVAYLKQLVSDGKAGAAREYFESAPTQIDTPLRARIRNELGWS